MNMCQTRSISKRFDQVTILNWPTADDKARSRIYIMQLQTAKTK